RLFCEEAYKTPTNVEDRNPVKSYAERWSFCGKTADYTDVPSGFWLVSDTDARQLETEFVARALSLVTTVQFTWVRGRRRFFRSVDRIVEDPTTAVVSIGHR